MAVVREVERVAVGAPGKTPAGLVGDFKVSKVSKDLKVVGVVGVVKVVRECSGYAVRVIKKQGARRRTLR